MFAKIKFMSKHCMCIFEHVLCLCVDVMCRVAFFSCHHHDIQLFNINLDTYFLICNVAINLDTWSSYLQCCHLLCSVARIPPVLTSDHFMNEPVIMLKVLLLGIRLPIDLLLQWKTTTINFMREHAKRLYNIWCPSSNIWCSSFLHYFFHIFDVHFLQFYLHSLYILGLRFY